MRLFSSAVFIAISLISFKAHATPWKCKRYLTTPRFEQEWIGKEGLDKNLETLKARAGENFERDGYFGPTSMLWEVSRVPFLALFAETELYLQLAHPAGAQGVFDHSKRLQEDPISRFQSTFDYLWRMVFDRGPEAERLSRTLHSIHSRIRGTMKDNAGHYKKGDSYSATEADALLWVHITHAHALLKTYEVFVRPLTALEKERYVADTVKFGMLFGIPEDLLPQTWQEFQDYFRYMLNSGELHYTPDALKLERHFREMSASMEKKNPAFWALRKYADVITASTLPEHLANQFGLKRSGPKKLAYYTALKALRKAYDHLPAKARDLPMYRIAMARALGKPIDPQDESLHRVFVGKEHPREVLKTSSIFDGLLDYFPIHF